MQMKAPCGCGLPARKRSSVRVAAGKDAEIYIGFTKGDYERPPGRKGRVIKDDPAKYPGREDMGPLLSVVGGWAGGEAGLWKLRDEYKASKQGSTQSATTKGPSSPIRQPSQSKWGVKTTPSVGKDAIYVGFGKDEIELRKSGIQGRIIYDDAYKYPGRDDIGPLPSVVGGFAGGEAALKAFAETGELKLRAPGEPIKRQFSPLVPAFMVVLVAAGGGLLLSAAGQLALHQVAH